MAYIELVNEAKCPCRHTTAANERPLENHGYLDALINKIGKNKKSLVIEWNKFITIHSAYKNPLFSEYKKYLNKHGFGCSLVKEWTFDKEKQVDQQAAGFINISFQVKNCHNIEDNIFETESVLEGLEENYTPPIKGLVSMVLDATCDPAKNIITAAVILVPISL